MTTRKRWVLIISGIILLIVFISLSLITANPSQKNQLLNDPTTSGRITEAIKNNLSDKAPAYQLSSIKELITLEDSYFYTSVYIVDQFSTTQVIPFVLQEQNEMYYTVVVGIGNDFTSDELTSLGLSSDNVSKITSLHAKDVPTQEDIQ